MTIEESWAAFREQLALSLPDAEGAIDTEDAARALALASAMAGWEAAKKDLRWTHLEVPAAAILALGVEIEALGQ